MRQGAFALGLGIVTASAVAVFGGASSLGWVTWGAFDPGPFLLFLVTNAVVALLLEAIPEELAVRGYSYAALREHYGRDVTVYITTGLFVAMGALLNVLASFPAAFSRDDMGALAVAPEGDDAVSYLMLLLVFGLMLGCAREAGPAGTIGAPIGAHLAMLTINRLTGFTERDTGLSMEFQTPGAILLYPAYLVLSLIGFSLLGRPVQPTRT